jgi:alanyl-tRNA synthetase
MRAQEIREAFLRFFADRGHKVVRSSSLVPRDDPTILFTNAGMNQFKNVFLGAEKRSYRRAVSVQKCLRVSGKHNDLETVGRTAKHHTFFEMLGNFSFGDYFKKEAIHYAWELVTKVFGLPPDRLYATVYQDDDEAYRIWAGEVGVPEERIFRFGKKDNFWAMGETGPCGPCSEIHFDFGPDGAAGEPRELIEQGSDRFVELWNLVFMEFEQDEGGVIKRLPSPSIDTGMGLERMAAVLQGKRSNFETDLFAPLIETVTELAGREYPSGDEADVAVRVIADHVRAVTFLIGDGVNPANDGRGYVLRRLIRRAFRKGNLIGIEEPFLYKLTGRVGDIMKEAYPELLASMNYISRVCLAEEERFSATLSSGLRFFDQAVKEAADSQKGVIPGDVLFRLYDTFGFPLDLSQELAQEKSLAVDEAGFKQELEKQRERARQSWKGEEKMKEQKLPEELQGLKVEPRCYETGEVADAAVLALLRDGETVKALKAGEKGEVVLSETPFYAEAGGAVGESGAVLNQGFFGRVRDTYYLSPAIIAHSVEAVSGELRPGDRVSAGVDLERRQAASLNHTATHLLHAALRQVLGDHVKQSGSLVSPERLRFDFTHFAGLSREELRRVEELVNIQIRRDLPVTIRVTSLEEGLKEGATAIFEEKYGEKVRVVSVADFSKELCGGIHARSTGEIGLFKIVSEASVASGIRRIEALTGRAALAHVWELEDVLGDVEKSLQAPRRELALRADKLREQVQELEKEAGRLRRKLAEGSVEPEAGRVLEIKNMKVLIRRVHGLNMAELRDLADSLKQKMGGGAVILGETEGDKVYVVVSIAKDLTGRLRADVLIKEISRIIDGGGGGRPDFAQAGGKKPGELDRLFEELPRIIEKTAA